MNPPTLTDVARLAGLSKGTVSLILAGKTWRFPPLTVSRIRELAQRVGYRPGQQAARHTAPPADPQNIMPLLVVGAPLGVHRRSRRPIAHQDVRRVVVHQPSRARNLVAADVAAL